MLLKVPINDRELTLDALIRRITTNKTENNNNRSKDGAPLIAQRERTNFSQITEVKHCCTRLIFRLVTISGKGRSVPCCRVSQVGVITHQDRENQANNTQISTWLFGEA